MGSEWTPAETILHGINAIARDVLHPDCDCTEAYSLPTHNAVVWTRMRGLIEDHAQTVLAKATRPLIETIENAILILEAGNENQRQAINYLRAALNEERG